MTSSWKEAFFSLWSLKEQGDLFVKFLCGLKRKDVVKIKTGKLSIENHKPKHSVSLPKLNLLPNPFTVVLLAWF